MIRVLVVDDSPTQRCLIRAILESDPALQVVGEACNGREAVELCLRLQPDIVTMDIRMPVMDGYEAIRHIMARSPRPIVALTSTASDRELGISFKATEFGALSVVGKPRGFPGEDTDADRLVVELKTMASVKVVRRRWRVPPEAEVPVWHLAPRPPEERVQIIAIGASTGGPPALQAILGALKADLPVPVMVVQHISRGFVVGLARWLDDTTPPRVVVAQQDSPLKEGVVYLAPDNHHLLVSRGGWLRLADSPPVDGHRPSVTALFESVARHYGGSAAGVLLTGMGDDGARGLKAIQEAGGRTIAQDKDSCVVFGMPQQAILRGAAHAVLALEQIGPYLAKLSGIRKGARQ